MAQMVRIEVDKISSAAAKKAGDAVEGAREKVTKFDISVEKTQRSLAKWAKEKYKSLLEVGRQIKYVLWVLGSSIMNLLGKTWNVTMKAVDLFTDPLSDPLPDIADIFKDSVLLMEDAASASEAMPYSFGEIDMDASSAEMGKTMAGNLTCAGLDGGIVTIAGPDLSAIGNEFISFGADVYSFNSMAAGILGFRAKVSNKLGAVIGAFFGGADAMSGVLIGAIISWIVGNKIKADVKFKREELNEALYVSETRTEKFVEMYQEAVENNLKNHFAEVTLSLREIQKIAKIDIFSKEVKRLQNYSEAVEQQNWKMVANKVYDTKESAVLNSLKTKYSTECIAASSFGAVQEELAARNQSILQEHYNSIQGAVLFVIRGIAYSVPEDQANIPVEKFKNTIPIVEEIKEHIDFTKISALDLYTINRFAFMEKIILMLGENNDFTVQILTGEEADYDERAAQYAERIHRTLENSRVAEYVQTFVNENTEKIAAPIPFYTYVRILLDYIAADGGSAAPCGADYEMSVSSLDLDEGNAFYTYCKGDNGSEKNTTIELNVSVNPEITINEAEGQTSEDVVGVIKRHIQELADELGGEIAAQLEASFSNRPLKEA